MTTSSSDLHALHRDPQLVLMGMMGSGKTTVGRLLAERTGWSYTDNDELVRRSSGREPADIRADDGEDALHDLETAALVEALGLPPPSIIGAAAGVVLDPVAVAALRASARVVWLRAQPSTLRARIGTGAGRRAEATDIAWLTQQAMAREDLYHDVADLIIDVDALPTRQVANTILRWLGRRVDSFLRPRAHIAARTGSPNRAAGAWADQRARTPRLDELHGRFARQVTVSADLLVSPGVPRPIHPLAA